MTTGEHIQSCLKTIPGLPGIYIFKDRQDNIIYVGKAANLRHRVSSYFQRTNTHTEKTLQLVGLIEKIEFVVTESEIAALMLECQQIKKFRPHFNVLMKDDKSYPYIKIDVKDPWPTISITRRRHNDGAKYIGRIPSAWSARQTYEFVKRIFPMRSCTKVLTGKVTRPCLKYHIKRCPAPCIGAISREEYGESVRHATAFLEGREEQLLRDLKKAMQAASRQTDFEKAGQLRDQIKAIEAVIAANRISLNMQGELDAVALARDNELACVRIFSVKDARLTSDEHFIVEDVQDETNSLVIESFLQQYYSSADHIPGLILIQTTIDNLSLVAQWLTERRGAKVELRVPARGTGLRLVKIVAENARQQLDIYKSTRSRRPENLKVLSGLKDLLGLPAIPNRIEAYDISNIQGSNAVGSMVVFENGLPKTGRYRRFRIRAVPQANDYAMMSEMLRRRFALRRETDTKWGGLPDLVLIDGGKGHLHAASQAVSESGASGIPIISIAKQNEEIFVPGCAGPLSIDRSSPELQLLQRVRDEAHRFAVTYHRKLRSSSSRESVLDSIAGIGPARRKALIKKFGSVHAIREASVEELLSVEGITSSLAAKIHDSLSPAPSI